MSDTHTKHVACMEKCSRMGSDYYDTLRVTEGCGERGDYQRGPALERWRKAYIKLSEEEKCLTKSPPNSIPRTTDDGLRGKSTGMAEIAKSGGECVVM